MTYSIYQLFQLFLLYSFLGWCSEVCYAAVTSGQVVNRGFLNGPVCPIYGVGMVGVLLLLEPISHSLPLLFLLGMLLCTLVELIGGWVLEKVFHSHWWDYSNQPFNLGGYICLGFSILWGLAVTFVVRLVHPFLMTVINLIPHTLGVVLLILLYALFTADLVITLVTIIGMKKRLGELDKVAEALQSVGDNISDRLGNTALAADAKLDEWKESSQEKFTESREKMEYAMETGKEKLAEAREKRAEIRETSREKNKERLENTLQELLERRQQLEKRQMELRAAFSSASKFGTRRLMGAFPEMRRSLKEHLDRMEKK
jgi:uncharacterized membrane protein